jgi:hypothetical protein
MNKIMSIFPVLSLSGFSHPFILECDASWEGIGAMLMQNHYPIYFKRRNLRAPERIYSIYDKEMLAIMHALAKFWQYLVGGRFVVRTDHNSLKYFLEKQYLRKRQHKSVSKLQAYEFDIEYVKGNKNVVFYDLSWRPSIFSLTKVSTNWKSTLLVEYSKNTFACELMEGTIQDDRYRSSV